MKNIHVLPTENESRIRYNSFNKVYELCEFPKYHTDIKSAHNIYITSDEEIEDGDWVYFISTNEVIKVPLGGFKGKVCKKIILTTDQYLIKDGVQAIDDEFLEWLVKNPSCESVGVKIIEKMIGSFNEKGTRPIYVDEYKTIIPQAEPKQEKDYTSLLQPVGTKQETLEEAAVIYAEENAIDSNISYHNLYAPLEYAFRNGAKWQSEQDKKMYSEEDLAEAFEAGKRLGEDNACMAENYRREDFKEWFEQFKNK